MLQPANRIGIEAQLIGCDRVPRPVTHRLQCLAQEAVCRTRVTPVQYHEVDQPAMLVDGAEQVLPLSTDLDMGFVHSPGAQAVALIPADALFELRRVALHPPEGSSRRRPQLRALASSPRDRDT